MSPTRGSGRAVWLGGSSPSRAGMTVLRSASTSPSGEPKRKKPDTLKSRRVLVLSAPSLGASASSGASLACRLGQRGWWAWGGMAPSPSHQPGDNSAPSMAPLAWRSCWKRGSPSKTPQGGLSPHNTPAQAGADRKAQNQWEDEQRSQPLPTIPVTLTCPRSCGRPSVSPARGWPGLTPRLRPRPRPGGPGHRTARGTRAPRSAGETQRPPVPA